MCAEGIERWERRGLCQRYGWTSRRTARVAHKRAGRRLRLQGDLERFSILHRPLRFLRVPVDAPWWRHKGTHLVPTWPLLFGYREAHTKPGTDLSASVKACILMMFVAREAARQRETQIGRSSSSSSRSGLAGPWHCWPACLLFGRSARW